jgi:hypothetical protein
LKSIDGSLEGVAQPSLTAVLLHEVVKRRERLVQIELEPPDVGEQDHLRCVLGLDGGRQLGGEVLVRVLVLERQLDVFLVLIELVDELLLDVGVVAANSAPTGEGDGGSGATDRRWRGCAETSNTRTRKP